MYIKIYIIEKLLYINNYLILNLLINIYNLKLYLG